MHAAGMVAPWLGVSARVYVVDDILHALSPRR